MAGGSTLDGTLEAHTLRGAALPRHALALLALLCLATPCAGSVEPSGGPPPLTVSEAAPGVWLFRTEPYGDVGLDGNSVAVVTDEGVLLLDANGTPAAARAVLAKLRTITKQPVRWLVLSHWHWDHWYGAEVYRDSFPGLQIVAHERTRALMDGPVQAFNRDGLETQLPGHVHAVESRRDTATGERRSRLAAHAARDRFFLEQKRSVRRTLPNVTFTDSLTIFAGGREIRVLHIDRAITPGDAFVWLPREGVLATGDLLIDPITFALFCYPDGWIRTLQYLAALDARVIVPGHGAPPCGTSASFAATLELLQLEREIARGARRGASRAAPSRARFWRSRACSRCATGSRAATTRSTRTSRRTSSSGSRRGHGTRPEVRSTIRSPLRREWAPWSPISPRSDGPPSCARRRRVVSRRTGARRHGGPRPCGRRPRTDSRSCSSRSRSPRRLPPPGANRPSSRPPGCNAISPTRRSSCCTPPRRARTTTPGTCPARASCPGARTPGRATA